jgi:N-acetylneuraminic acid mutarotase
MSASTRRFRLLARVLLILVILFPSLAEPLSIWAAPLAAPLECQGGTITLIEDGAQVTIENPVVTGAGVLGCNVSGQMHLVLKNNNLTGIPISGRVDSYGAFSGSDIGPFNLEIAGLTFKVAESTFRSGELLLTSTRIKIPASWGGLEATLPTTLTINRAGLLSPEFGLPEIKAGKFALKLLGRVGAYGSGFSIVARGMLTLPDFGGGKDCYITAHVTIGVDAAGSAMLIVDTPGAGKASLVAHRSQIALPEGQAVLQPAYMPVKSSYLPVPETLPASAWAQVDAARVRTVPEEPQPVEELPVEAPAINWSVASDLPESDSAEASNRWIPLDTESLLKTTSEAGGYQTVSERVEPQALDLLEVTAGFSCMGSGIPIGTTGFQLSELTGWVKITPQEELVGFQVTFESQLEVAGLPAITAEGGLEVQWSPEFRLAMWAGVSVLKFFQVSETYISISKSDGLRFVGTWNSYLPIPTRSQLAVHAWLTRVQTCMAYSTLCAINPSPLPPTCTSSCSLTETDTRFHFTGSASIQVGLAKGQLLSISALPYPCHWSICRKWFIRYPCCKWCYVTIDIPPIDLWLAGAQAEFGEFTGGHWGLKGTVSILGFTVGFYFDTEGNVDFGDVSQYTLVDAAALQIARDAWREATLVGGPSAAFAGDDRFTFLSEDQALVRVQLPMEGPLPSGVAALGADAQDAITYTNVISQSDTMFTVKSDVPLEVSLVAPGGIEITPENLDVVTYTVQYTQTVATETVSEKNPDEENQVSRWRFIPASNVAALATVDVLLNGVLAFSNVSVGDARVMPYAEIVAGTNTVEVHPAGGGSPAVIKHFDVAPGSDYTAVLIGDTSAELLVVEDDNSAPPSGMARVRVIDAASGADPLEVTIGDTSFDPLTYRQVSGYQTVSTVTQTVSAVSRALNPATGRTGTEAEMGATGPETPAASAYYGSTVAWAGDVNGDGYDDLLVGDSGFPAIGTDRGRVHLYYGTPSGVAAVPAWTEEGENDHDLFGIAIASAGDVNSDGYADVLIGAYGYDSSRGKVYLYLGSATGLAADPVWTAQGEYAGDQYGTSVAGAGDVDGDGHDDIVIGAAGYASAQGKIYLYYGSPNGIVTAWSLTGSLNAARMEHQATLLADGRVLVTGGYGIDYVAAGDELYDPSTGLWRSTASLSGMRAGHTATLLPNGKVLVTGGHDASWTPRASADLYDPVSELWTPAADLSAPRYNHTATLLQDGKVLVTGGLGTDWQTLATAEVYDPQLDLWTPAGSMANARYDHVAVLLNDGRVLVLGNGAELYDPLTYLWAPAESPSTRYEYRTATLLKSGQVLVAGGGVEDGITAVAELYDPLTGLWTPTGNMVSARTEHRATLLADGRVLVTGGYYSDYGLAGAEVYDPATASWTPAGGNDASRVYHSSTLLPSGKVLLAGGDGGGSNPLVSADLFDPEGRERWTATGEYAGVSYGSTVAGAGDVNGDGFADMLVAAFSYIPGISGGRGKVYLYQGEPGGPLPFPSWTLVGAEQGDELGTAVAGAGDVNGDGYDDVVLGAPGYPAGARRGQAYIHYGSGSGVSTESGITLAGQSDGDWFGSAVAGAGDVNGDGYDDVLVGAYQALGDPPQGQATLYYGSALGIRAPGWSPAQDLNTARKSHSATRLASGLVLVVGTLTSAEVYDPATGAWAYTGSLKRFHSGYTATLLEDGDVLVTGGWADPSVELYDPALGTWGYTGALAVGRINHSATLLSDGRVLVVGGEGTAGRLASAELYDPDTGQWSATGSLGLARFYHTATLLNDGRVLVVGGYAGDFTATAEIYDPATGLWTPADDVAGGRPVCRHAAVLLQDGRVLISGGEGLGVQTTAQIFDPATGHWSLTGSMATARVGHRALVLDDGRVLVVGGKGVGFIDLGSAEVYDPAAGTWSDAGSLATARWLHTATVLEDGRVLVAGGESAGAALASVEVFSAGRTFWTVEGQAGEYLGISLAGAADANGDGRADLAAGAPGTQRAYAYYGALGLAATDAPVSAGDVQTLILARIDGSPDALSLLQVRDASYVSEEALITTTSYIVDQAPPGEWAIKLVGETDDAHITISVAAPPDPPIIDELTVDASDLSDTKVSYRLLSDYTPVTMAIYANDGPLTETMEIELPEELTGAAAITSTEVITLYQGTQVATLDLTSELAVQNSLITTSVDLSVLESGDYKLWVRVEDGVSPPVQGYVWGVEAYAAAAQGAGALPAEWNRVRIAAEDYDAGLQAAGAATISIDHTPEWSGDFTSSLSARIQPEELHVQFTPYQHPDVDEYRMEVTSAGVTHVMAAGISVFYEAYDETGTPVADPVYYFDYTGLVPRRSYTVRVVAIDLDREPALESWSQAETFTVPLGDMTLAAVEPAITLPAGETVVTATLALTMTEDLFSDVHLSLDRSQLPPEITLQGFVPETVGGAGSLAVLEAYENIAAPSRLPAQVAAVAGGDVSLTISALVAVAAGAPAAEYALPFVATSGELERRAAVTLSVAPAPPVEPDPETETILHAKLPLPTCATSIVVTIPADAFPSGTGLQLRQVSSNVVRPRGARFDGVQFVLSAVDGGGNPVQPGLPMALEVDYDPACLGGLDEETMHLRKWIQPEGWVKSGMSCSVSAATDTLACTLSQTGQFALFENYWEAYLYLPLVRRDNP